MLVSENGLLNHNEATKSIKDFNKIIKKLCNMYDNRANGSSSAIYPLLQSIKRKLEPFYHADQVEQINMIRSLHEEYNKLFCSDGSDFSLRFDLSMSNQLQYKSLVCGLITEMEDKPEFHLQKRYLTAINKKLERFDFDFEKERIRRIVEHHPDQLAQIGPITPFSRQDNLKKSRRNKFKALTSELQKLAYSPRISEYLTEYSPALGLKSAKHMAWQLRNCADQLQHFGYLNEEEKRTLFIGFKMPRLFYDKLSRSIAMVGNLTIDCEVKSCECVTPELTKALFLLSECQGLLQAIKEISHCNGAMRMFSQLENDQFKKKR
ncbi:hypothetical protein AKO1_007159 [Acrasis kona]|uniref:Uncharacterized protein n=1 Tax=Acrasis kona TaxID=1008807 RepID=A0AAW2YSX8_9EUKA